MSAAGAAADAAPLMSVRGLVVNYGHIEAVKGIDLDLHEGKVTTLVGPHGAGNSTPLQALSGLVRKAARPVLLDGHDIGSQPPHRIVGRGVVQVAEGRATLTTMTVRENLELGAYSLRGRRGGATERGRDLDKVFAMFPRLAERQRGLAGNLSGGEQQMLAIGRALMARPRLLLLDEPSMGLAPIIVQDIFRTLRQINRDGLTIFLVEQNVRQALKIADHGYVLDTGKVVLEGSGAALLDEPRVQQAYLGG